ncbi:Taurine dioxygenase, alpha-ketoglutarate-dependent [Streptomyces sp. 2112.3]|uniref:TauD/TfdA family dioxygenase n=1 Tax=Streptomyces sp. 2112.3 TaxID=1881023 RepID=UPI00089742EF|nr:TauD/TfdA family dioxygenase [Streptomyces sp. 2112.3]SED97229.1 Taurine dioxygenase, alpha-ketoglutarate-dependent [Streptomyces sp. 2112.3]
MTVTTDGTTTGAALPDGREPTLDAGRTPLLEVPGADFETLSGPAVRDLVARHGALLVRGLGLNAPADLARAARWLGVTAMTEREGFTSRTDHGDGVYSASQWPADEPMCMHHELSYAVEVPSLALFGCLTAPASGGATAVADARTLLRTLPAGLVERFEREGWLLDRDYREVGVSRLEAFGSEDRAEADAYCAGHAIAHEWLADGALRTRQRRAAVVAHPVTGERLWFNQIAFLNELTLDPAVREYLTSFYGPGALPFNTGFGDGEAITEDVIETINAAYTAATSREPWQTGDLLVVDNLRMAHSREAYQGDREVVALFGDPVRLTGHVRTDVPARPTAV